MFVGINAHIVDEQWIKYADFYEAGLRLFKTQKKKVYSQLNTYLISLFTFVLLMIE